MGLKNFKTRNGIDVDTYTIPNTVVQATVKTNSATTVDTIAMASFTSAEYLVTISQGSKVRTSKVVMHTDGTSVDMTEYGITETGGAISGVVVSATTSSTNAVLQVTVTDAASTIARVKMSRNLNVIYTAQVPDAPTIGTATASSGSASVTFTAPYDNGGASITGYTVTSSPGSFTGTGSSSPIVVSGLTAGTSYTFTVTATNSAGTSVASSASNSATPPSPNSGYFAGGTFGDKTAVDKFLFADDTRTTLATGLSVGAVSASGFANSGTAGYVAGGFRPSSNSTIVDKFTFPSDSRTTLATGLSAAKESGSGMANSGTAGYYSGGNNTTTQTNAIDKFAFSNDSRTTIAGTLSYARKSLAGMANSGTAGYLGGGYSTFNGAPFDRVDKLVFSNDSVSTITDRLSSNRQELAAMANSGTAGYFGGGTTGSSVNTVDKYTFSTDARTTLATGLSSARAGLSGFANSGTAGYFGGGAASTTVDKFAFSNDSRSTLATGLTTGNNNQASFANSGTL